MVDPRKWNTQHWLNFTMFGLAGLATGGWWGTMFGPEIAAMIAGGLAWVVSLLNFILADRVTQPVKPPDNPLP